MHEAADENAVSLRESSALSSPVGGNVRAMVRMRALADDAVGACVVCLPNNTEVQIYPAVHSMNRKDSMTGGRARNSTSTQAADRVQRFTFDRVFGPEVTQDDVGLTIVPPLVTHVMQGYNATILSYGQTGSGKTYTMLGPRGGAAEVLEDTSQAASLGIVPRFFSHLFKKLAAGCSRPDGGEKSTAAASRVEFVVTIGVAELYNEVLRDLAPRGTVVGQQESAPDGSPRADEGHVAGLRIREDARSPEQGVYIEGLTEHTVTSAAEAMSVICASATRRVMGSTRMNETSSRSHTIVHVRTMMMDHAKHDQRTSARVHLVDLAGSERVGKTGAFGDRLREAQSINLSLSLLGNVISKLSDANKSLHIPYRDAQLTRLLQDSLGGSALTTLMCSCSLEQQHLSETTSTLGFAQRAKFIKNEPIANVHRSLEETESELALVRREVRELREQTQTLRALKGVEHGTMDVVDSEGAIRSLTIEVAQLQDELREACRVAHNAQAEADFYQKRGIDGKADAAPARASSSDTGLYTAVCSRCSGGVPPRVEIGLQCGGLAVYACPDSDGFGTLEGHQRRGKSVATKLLSSPANEELAQLRAQVACAEARCAELEVQQKASATSEAQLANDARELEQTVKRLHGQREVMRCDIERLVGDDGALKQQLLAALAKGHRSAQESQAIFRRKLLDCFAL